MGFVETSLMRQLGKLVEVVRHANEVLGDGYRLCAVSANHLAVQGGLTGNLLSAPVSPSLEPVVEIPSHGSQVRAGKVTGPEEYKRRFLVPAPRAAEWKTAYIDGRLHRRIAMLVRAAGCGSISGFIIRLLELHMEEHREDIASLLGEVYRPWDEDGQPGGTPRR